jgi:Leucine-rich repeat (LRR) protein
LWLSVNLQKLVLSGNQLSGALTAPLADPKAPPCKLQVLDLSYNKLDQIPELAFWSHTQVGLQELYLQGNTFPLVPASGGHALKACRGDRLCGGCMG